MPGPVRILNEFYKDERGDVAISYALIASAMVIGMAIYLVMMGDDIDGLLQPASTGIASRAQ